MLKIRTYQALIGIASLILGSQKSVRAEIVYDLISQADFGGGNLLGYSSETGQIVTLGGQHRIVTSFDIVLAGFNPPPYDAAMQFRVRFRYGDDLSGLPGEEIWISRLIDVDLPARINQIVSVSVPHVSVPAIFAWTLEDVFRHRSAGIPFAGGAVAGTPGRFVEFGDNNSPYSGKWRTYANAPDNGFGV